MTSTNAFGSLEGYSLCKARDEAHLQPGDLLYNGNMNLLEALELRHQRLLQDLYHAKGLVRQAFICHIVI